jgi:transposase
LARLATKVEPTYHELIRAARASLVNGMDETGWRVGGRLQWMWVAVSAQVTIDRVLPGRGFAEAALLLGADYFGWLVHDGLRCDYGFELAFHQSCLAHLLRRCRDLVQVVAPSAARFPLQVRSLLEKALALRDRYGQGRISLHGLWTAGGRLEARLDRLLARSYRTEANRRLAQHLRHEQPHLFTSLDCPGLEATKQRGRAGLVGRGDRAQDLGRQPHLAGRAHAGDPGQRTPDPPAAGPGCLCPAGGAAALAGSPGASS